MATYLGKVVIQNNYYNYTPVAELSGKTFVQLSENEVDRLLPASSKRNINLSYSFFDDSQVKFMREHFRDGQLVLFSFDAYNLQGNYDTYGNRNYTGYKVDAAECVKNKRIRSLTDEGFYYLKDLSILEGDLTEKTVRIKDGLVLENEKILINAGKGFFAGPYKVKYSPTNDICFIKTDIVENLYLISGYKSDNCRKQMVEDGYSGTQMNEELAICYIKDPAQVEYRDTVTEEQLLSAVKEEFSSDKSNSDNEAYNIESIMQSKNSLLASDKLPEQVKKDRLLRIKTLLETDTENQSAMTAMADIVYGLLSKKPTDARAEKLIELLLEKEPERLESVQSYRVIRDRIESSKHELEELQANIEETKNVMSEGTAEKELLQETNDEYQKLLDKIKIADSIDALEERLSGLKNDVSYYESHKAHLSSDTRTLESQFVDTVNKYSDQMVGLTFDGFMSSKMLRAASEWEARERSRDLNQLVERVEELDTPMLSKAEVVDYIVTTVQKERPQYDKNTILNIMICITQGFLTVFSGAPGCGKTSISNIVSKSLGLTKISDLVEHDMQKESVNRYVPVSVERGWTSKRDFIGYYNPLTKAFEETNRDIFDGLQVLNLEFQKGFKSLPFIVLLDEANLSPMEYYWADFMNVCDDLENNHVVNLGSNYVFQIPETLHFLATINNDHTTETLSPRLVDRAWVVTLPKMSNVQYGMTITDDMVKLISWPSLVSAFGAPEASNTSLGNELQRLYDEFRKLFAKIDISISPRSDLAIKKYCYAASRVMDEDEFGNSAGVVALDYAILQKLLPKISGNGDDYRERLNELLNYLKSNNLLKSADAVTGILRQGDRQLKYYKFF